MSEELRQIYEREWPLFDHLRAEAVFVIEKRLASENIKLHSVTSRIKTWKSLYARAVEKNLSDPFKEIPDIIGLRIVCLFLSDIPRIAAVIRASFNVLHEDDKVEGGTPASFGYMSVHFHATMRTDYSGPRYDDIAGMPFEIQVRTIAMDAWANVSHHLSYKSERDVPEKLKRDFFALSGLFYVADKHFEMFFAASKDSRSEMTKLFEGTSIQKQRKQAVNLDTVAAYLTSRFPDRFHTEGAALSDLVGQLLEAGYETISDIDLVVSATYPVFEELEKRHPPPSGNKFWDVAALRGSLEVADPTFHRLNYLRLFHNRDQKEVQKWFEDADRRYQPFRNQFAGLVPTGNTKPRPN